MYKNIELTFEKGTILTREMLCELRAFPMDLLDIQYQMYPDGVLAGMEVSMIDGNVYIKGGLIKYQGRIYRCRGDINLSELIGQWKQTGQIEAQIRYKLMFVPKEAEQIDGRSTQVAHSLQLGLAQEPEEMEGIFFASFKLPSSGTVAIYHENDVKDISKAEFWNMMECPYACRGGVTYHPYIFEVLKQKLAAKPQKTDLDYMVLNQIITAGVLDIAWIKAILEEEETKKRQDGQETAGIHPGYSCWEELFAAGKLDAGSKATVLKAFLEAMMQERAIPSRECEKPPERTQGARREEGRMLE